MKSLHYKLFIRYAALIFPLIIIFMILLYIILGKSLQGNATNELQADCDNISTLLDTQLDQIDQLSKRIVSSDSLQTLFVQDLYSYDVSSYNNRLSFSNALFDIIKLSFNHMNLNMFDTYGRYIYVGNTSSFEHINPDALYDISWFTYTLNQNGKKVLLPPHIPDLNSADTPVISLCRSFASDISVQETAVLELQLEYTFLDKKIQNALHNQKDMKQVYVFDTAGNLVYPYKNAPSAALGSCMKDIAMSEDVPLQKSIYKVREVEPTLFVRKKSDFTGWTVFVSASEKKIFSSFYQFRTLLIGASLLLLFLLLLITWQIANKLTIPLKKLEQTAHALTINNLDTFDLPSYKSSFQELDSLYHSFEQMQHNLQSSLLDTLSAYSMAADSKMLALQSQMNPHFLYNTLASIGVLAEDGENEQVVQMCDSLSSLLRYMSSNASINVALWQEIEYLHSYIYLIKVKYEERIQFHIDITGELLPLKVPRLLIQPLVENCIKYALNVDPPWNICIRGYIKDKNWIIEVEDNGAGFSLDFLNSFSKKVEAIDWKKPLPELSINGMGLLNLYTRLFLKYKEDVIFQLKNLPDHGAIVVIGGPLATKTGENMYET